MKAKQFFVISIMIGFIFAMGMRSAVRAQESVTAPADEIQSALDSYEKSAVLQEGPRVIAPIDQNVVSALDIPASDSPVLDPAQPSQSSASTPPEQSTSLMMDVLELKDMDIGDVLKLISKKSGLNIVSGRDVVGKVTIYLKNVDVRDALRIILESNNLAYIEENSIIKIIPGAEYEKIYGYKFGQDLATKIIPLKYVKTPEVVAVLDQLKSQSGKISSDAVSNTVILVDRLDKIVLMEDMIQRMDIPVVTRAFEIRYSKAEDVAKKIESFLSKNIGKVEYDGRSSKVLVTDTEEKLGQIAKMIQTFDTKHPEVLIEAKIVQVNLNDQYKLGVDWEAIVSDFHSLDLASQFDILSSTDKRGKLSIGTLSGDDYTVLIEALQTVGDTNILSNPRITVINNEEAKILVGSSEPYVTTQTTTTSSGPSTTAETVNFIEVGVKLYVTPVIHGDGYVTMKIRPEVSARTDYLTTSTNNKIPIVETSQAETTVMVKDGITIVIGGLIKEQDSKTINKVPLLGDIPVLGRVFRNEDKEKTKTEIIIFLTPTIVTGDKPSTEKVSARPEKKK